MLIYGVYIYIYVYGIHNIYIYIIPWRIIPWIVKSGLSKC